MTSIKKNNRKKQWFGTDGIRGRVGDLPITADFMLRLGWAFGSVLKRREEHPRVIIGKDTRISGYMFESALEAGLSAAGVDVYLLGPLPTPAVAYLTHSMQASAGIVISASHNTYSDNGIKFFNRHGFKLSTEVEFEIEAQLELPVRTVFAKDLGKVQRLADAAGRYLEFCKHRIFANDPDFNLRGLKIILDTAHGAAYQVAPRILSELGANVIVLHDDPNGLNINLDCGSVHPEHLVERVKIEQADLGIGLDGDADRLVLVDHLGQVRDGDDILYLISQFQTVPPKGIVGTFMTNLALEKICHEKNIGFVRSAVGDRFVLEKLQELGWELGGESSGHLVNLAYHTTGDAILSALQVLLIMRQSGLNLSQLMTDFEKYPQILINFPIMRDIFLNGDAEKIFLNPRYQACLSEIETQMGDSGRIVSRFSGTEPILRIMLESKTTWDQIRCWGDQLIQVIQAELALSGPVSIHCNPIISPAKNRIQPECENVY